MTHQELISLIEEAGHGDGIRSYSGRGMNGQRCVGVEVDCTLQEFIADLIDVMPHGESALVREIRTDSMGLGKIIYFPRVGWPSDQ